MCAMNISVREATTRTQYQMYVGSANVQSTHQPSISKVPATVAVAGICHQSNSLDRLSKCRRRPLAESTYKDLSLVLKSWGLTTDVCQPFRIRSRIKTHFVIPTSPLIPTMACIPCRSRISSKGKVTFRKVDATM